MDSTDTDTGTEIAQAPPPPFVLPSNQKPQATTAPTTAPPFVLPSTPAPPPPVAPTPPIANSGGIGGEAMGMSPDHPQEIAQPTTPKYEDYPTIADLPIDKLPRTPGASDWADPDLARKQRNIAFGPAMAETVEGKQNILKENLPGATFEKDAYGNPLVVYEGKKYHISRPDSFNKQDVGEAVLQAAPTAVLATGAALAGPVGWVLGAAEMAAAGYLGNQFRAWAGRQAGSGEQADATSGSSIMEAVINAIIPVGGKAVSSIMKRFGSSEVAPEVAPGVQRVLATKTAAEELLAKTHPDDLYFHTNPANAASLVRQLPHTEVANKVEAAAVQHAKQAPVRVAKGLDETIGVADTNIKAAIDTVKGPASKELTEAFAQSGPLNIAPMMVEIDQAIAKAGNTPAGNALKKLRSMLIEQEGTAGTASTREAVEGTVPGRPIYREVPGQPGTEARYVTDAQKLNDIKREFDRMIKYGDRAAGIEPQAISTTDFAIGNVRQRLSGMLNDNVQGYGALMERYQSAYDMHDAYLMGQKIMTGGKGALKLEDVVPYLKGNPNEAKGFEIGVRDAIDNVIRTAADGKDAAAIKKILSGDNSYRREILEEMFGKEKIDAIVQMAEREGNYAIVNNQMVDAVQQGRDMSGIAQAGKLKEPVVGTVVPYATPTAIALNAGSKVLNKIGSFLAGSQGSGFEAKLANTLTSQARPVLEAVREGAKPAVNQIGAVTSPAVPPAMAEGHRRQERDKLPRAAGGRAKYKFDCASRASKLCREAELIRKRHAGGTKQLLNVSDDEIADALRVAGGRI